MSHPLYRRSGDSGANSTTSDRIEAMVYTCGSDATWRRLSTDQFPYKLYEDRDGAYVKGSPHYLVVRDDLEVLKDHVIVCFDASDETFKEIARPDWLDRKCSYFGGYLGVFDGMLSLCRLHAKAREVWVMREYNVKESWTMLFAVPAELTLREFVPIYSINDQEVCIQVSDSDLVKYNIETGLISIFFSICGPKYRNITTSAGYVESLVWPYPS